MKRVRTAIGNDMDAVQGGIFIYFFFLFTGLASVRPEPADKESFIKTQTYELTYPSALPDVYSWPKM